MERTQSIIEIPRKTPDGKGWWFQYARWDVRVDCPRCGQWEAFLFSIKDAQDDGTVLEPGRCRGCGLSEPIRLLGLTQEALDRADAREKNMAFNKKEWQHVSDKSVYDRTIPAVKEKT